MESVRADSVGALRVTRGSIRIANRVRLMALVYRPKHQQTQQAAEQESVHDKFHARCGAEHAELSTPRRWEGSL